MKDDIKIVPVDELITQAPFRELMPFDKKAIGLIVTGMKKNGYDSAFPIVTWKGHGNVVIDGHLRAAAAHLAGLETVSIFEHEFQTEKEAVAYAMHNNLYRGHYLPEDLGRRLENAEYALLEKHQRQLSAKCRIMTIEVTL